MKRFWETTSEADVPLTLKILIDYLLAEGVSRNIVSKMIALAHGHGVLEAEEYK
jgi:hypothetical protein